MENPQPANLQLISEMRECLNVWNSPKDFSKFDSLMFSDDAKSSESVKYLLNFASVEC